MSQRSWQRWTPMSGALFVVLIVVGFVVGGSSPDTDAPDAKIAAYLAKSSNQDRNFVAFFILMAAMLALIWFYSTLRSRLAQADGGGRRPRRPLRLAPGWPVRSSSSPPSACSSRR